MNTNVWTESGGELLKETLRQEARLWHQWHQPPTRLADWNQQRQTLRRRLLAAAGVALESSALDIREHGTIAMDGYRIVKLTYQSRVNLRVTANLFIPDGLGPFPAVLNVHGHFSQGKIAVQVAARGHLLAQEGFVVLSVDAIGAGERGTVPGAFDSHGHPGVPLFSVGETLLGAQVYDNMRAIDLLESLDYVDGARIGVTGASGGGNQTMWIAALDPRIKAAVPVVSVGTFESYVTNMNCWCETLPDGLKISESWGVLGLIAPNPLLILTGQREQLPAFLPKEMLRAYGDARKIYALYGSEEKIAYQIIDLPHGYFPEMRRHMLGWFKLWLQDRGNGLPCAIAKDPELPEKDLMCFPGKTRPQNVKSLIAYVSLRTQALKKECLAQPKVDREKKIQELQQMIRLPGGPDYIRCSAVVAGEDDGRRYAKFTVESEPGVLVPCVLLFPAKAYSSVVIAAHPDGKDACLRHAASQKVLAEGKALCLVDLRDIGESRWSHTDDQMCLFAARAALWLGRTVMGDWVKDVSAVRAALLTVVGTKRVELLGFGDTGIPGLRDEDSPARARGAVFGNGETALVALVAAALDKRFGGVTVHNLLSTYVVNGAPPVQRYSIVAPGMLRWGDVSLLAALVRCPLHIESLVHPSGKPLSKRGAEDWQKEVRLRSATQGRGRMTVNYSGLHNRVTRESKACQP